MSARKRAEPDERLTYAQQALEDFIFETRRALEDIRDDADQLISGVTHYLDFLDEYGDAARLDAADGGHLRENVGLPPKTES